MLVRGKIAEFMALRMPFIEETYFELRGRRPMFSFDFNWDDNELVIQSYDAESIPFGEISDDTVLAAVQALAGHKQKTVEAWPYLDPHLVELK